ncbi:MAG: hypothetical protein CMK78_11475 [Pseudomonadales bacterium]|nr:hypothetical protein [Pseudomonadales bacterium]|tara:strand:- start:2405 stop:3169 length:765 start_codon:yes stop_codon:yes gene_type:complete
MAGEWIKMRTNLWDDPRVSRLCDLTDQPEAMVVGALYWLWAMADEHSEDGVLPGLTPGAIDRKTGVKGLGAALVAIGWLADHPEGVCVVNFDEHNGASAKRRSMEAKRKASARKVSAPDADKNRTPSGARTREDLNPSHTSAGEPASTGDPEPTPDPDSPVAMTLDWQPEERLLAAYAKRAGLPLPTFTPDAIAPFVLHHEPRGQVKTPKEWTADLVRWVKRDVTNASRVVTFPSGRPQPADPDDTSWIKGLEI